MTNHHLMETQNLVISFDYSWFLAKNLAYAECRIMKFYYRNSSNAEVDPILSSRHLWPKSIQNKWLWFLSQCHSWSPNQTRKRHDVDRIKLPGHELYSNEINIVYICIRMFKSVQGLNFRLGVYAKLKMDLKQTNFLICIVAWSLDTIEDLRTQIRQVTAGHG